MIVLDEGSEVLNYSINERILHITGEWTIHILPDTVDEDTNLTQELSDTGCKITIDEEHPLTNGDIIGGIQMKGNPMFVTLNKIDLRLRK